MWSRPALSRNAILSVSVVTPSASRSSSKRSEPFAHMLWLRHYVEDECDGRFELTGDDDLEIVRVRDDRRPAPIRCSRRYSRRRPSARHVTSPTSLSTRRCFDTWGWDIERSSTIVATAFSPVINASRISRRRTSAIALKTSDVVEERATAPTYSVIGIYQTWPVLPSHPAPMSGRRGRSSGTSRSYATGPRTAARVTADLRAAKMVDQNVQRRVHNDPRCVGQPSDGPRIGRQPHTADGIGQSGGPGARRTRVGACPRGP